MWLPTTAPVPSGPSDGDPDVVARDEGERGKEFTTFKGLDQGSTVGQWAAGHADGLAAEESR